MSDFPYRNKLYTDDERITLFKNIINYNLNIKINNKITPYVPINVPLPYITYLGNFIYLRDFEHNYLMMNILSDTFNDICRANCTFGKNMSPYDYFIKNKNDLINKLKKKQIQVNDKNIRNEIYLSTHECSIHNPNIIKFFITFYKARRILDMSSGWGDRLIGSIASDIDLYYGVDPNSCLHPNYKNMINLLLKYSPNPKCENCYTQ